MQLSRAPRVTRLPNGIRVASDPMPGAGWVSLGVFVACAPLFERPHERGAAHAIEHMVLGRGPGDQIDRLRRLDVTGAINAATAGDHTVYEADLLPDRLDDALELLAEAIAAPAWHDWEIERRVLIEETRLASDDPADLADLCARRAVFGSRHPYGRPIEGSVAALATLTVAQLSALHARTHVGANLVVVAAGEVEHAPLVDGVRRHFGRLPRGQAVVSEAAAPASVPARGARMDVDRTHLVVAAPSPGIGDPAWDAIAHIDALLGGMWSARLNLELRERRGLAYDVWSAANALRGAGIVMAGAATDPQELVPAARVIGRALRALRTGRGDPRDYATARTWVCDQTRMAMTSPAVRTARLGRRLMADLSTPAAATDLRSLAAVDPATVRAVAAALWRPSRLRLVTVGAPPSGAVAAMAAALGTAPRISP